MMEDLVCTFKQAKQLVKKLPQKQTVLWWKVNSEQTVVVSDTDKCFCEKYAGMVKNRFYPAYTSGELIDYFPTVILKNIEGVSDISEMRLKRWWRVVDNGGKRSYGCLYDYQSKKHIYSTEACYGSNEAEALAGLLLHLIKEKYVKLKKG
jgi:alkylated DNA nucleotide flippase Atl1